MQAHEARLTHDCYSTKRTTVWPQEEDGKPGRAVKYGDGYISWCPEDVYERDYNPVEGGHLTFGQAIAALQSGRRVRRLGWNGKGMFLILVPGSENLTVEEGRPFAKAGVPIGTKFDYLPHIDLRTVNGDFTPWAPSQTDMLSDDWEELPFGVSP